MGVIAAFLIIEHFRGAWALNRWKARMAAKGEVLNIDKLAPIPPSPDDNGMPQLLWVAGQLGQFPTHLLPPGSRAPTIGKLAVVTRINEWRVREAKRTNVTWVEIAENLSACEQRIDAALEALQSAAFNANLYYRGGFNGMALNHFTRIKSVAQFLSVGALHDLHQSQNDAAFQKLQGLLAVPEVLKDEPTLISQAVRMGTMHTAFAATWQALQSDGWSDAHLAALQDSWSAYDFLRPIDRAFAMERAMALVEYERCRSSDLPLLSMFDQGGPVAPPPTPSLLSWDWVGQMFDPRERVFAPIWKFAWSRQDELHYCQTVQAALEAHRKGVVSNAGIPVFGDVERIESAALGPYGRLRFFIGRMLIGSLANLMRRAWVAQTTAEITRTAIAIKRYELREGKLPDALEALVPEFLSRVPVDYMDGKPLRYCMESDGEFVLYSIGVDGRDGHGDATYATGTRSAPRDIIWPRAASDVDILGWRTSR